MNWENHILFSGRFNGLISTVCSPENPAETILKNSNPPANESGFQRAPAHYSPSSVITESGSEQVPASF
jgi:hypothetical protein